MPPPICPARVENFMPTGVIPWKSRSTIITPFASGTIPAIHSKHPHEVMGSTSIE